jgi:hypothetical protein
MSIYKEIRSNLWPRMYNVAWPMSRKKKYHFIHIPKNGGNSVRVALNRRRDVSATKPYHSRYIDVADKVGRHLLFFSIIRNPWSRTASRFVFAKQNSKSWPEDDPRRLYITKASFDDYVKDQQIFEIPEHPRQPWMGPMNSWFNQLEWLRDENGRVVCDCLRLEYLDHDLSAYFGENLRTSRRNVTETRYDYRRMYTDELAEIVNTTFKDDIEYFGFDFDSPATKNVVTT